jgi:phenylalanyl-tRNA synthetase beta subunit
MKVLKSWLQEYIVEILPEDSVIEHEVTRHAFEVEGVEKVGADTVFDFKIIPDRAHDALSHLGIARELAAIFSVTLKPEISSFQGGFETKFTVDVEDARRVPNFCILEISGVSVGASPAHITKKLEALGQRSINSVVDATNYVMLALGKPLHAFDADKIVGETLFVRNAKKGEKITTLDGKEVILSESDIVIADEEGPLSIAGIKGGKRAEVDKNTKRVIIESANFLGSSIRKTGTRVGIKTDASKRFESGITSELSLPALALCASIITESAGDKNVRWSEPVIFYPKKEKRYTVGVSLREVNMILGMNLTEEDVIDILTKKRCEPEIHTLEEIVLSAKTLEGSLYKRGASVLYDAPHAFDCSSFTAFIYAQAGIQIPRIAVDQFVFSFPVEGAPQRGDLIFTNTGVIKTKEGSYYSSVLEKNIEEAAIRFESVEWMPGTPVPQGVDHVGLYLGEGKVLHATSQKGVVVLESLSESPQFQKGFEVRRIADIKERRFVVQAPFDRLDLRIKEDLIDDIGRLVGYEDSKESSHYESLPKGSAFKTLAYGNILRKILTSHGFSEAMTYSFADAGDIAIINSVDPKRNKLRTSLEAGMTEALLKGLYHKDFLGKDIVKAFEIGNIFEGGRETVSLAFGYAAVSSKKLKRDTELESIFQDLKNILGDGFSYKTISGEKTVLFIVSLSSLLLTLPEKGGYKALQEEKKENFSYESLSVYPSITRDIAVFVEDSLGEPALLTLLEEENSPLLKRFYRFDSFKKEGDTKTSYAYRFVFQSMEKTLTDDDVNPFVDGLYKKVTDAGFSIR